MGNCCPREVVGCIPSSIGGDREVHWLFCWGVAGNSLVVGFWRFVGEQSVESVVLLRVVRFDLDPELRLSGFLEFFFDLGVEDEVVALSGADLNHVGLGWLGISGCQRR